ncbi:MAG: hypothetical protein HY821_21245 [Acidobacteria bacterium]|nr:hypothetical protein [Acidobacteriota bacterium]
MFTNEELQQRVAEALKRAGVDLVNVVTSPAALDRATSVVCGLLPFGFRHLGKERVRGIILQIAERVPRSGQGIEPIQSSASTTVEHEVDDRLKMLQDQIRQSFGESFGTKKSLRGYDADLDVLCGRLIRECNSLEAVAGSDRTTLVRILVAKAQVLGNWQKLQGSGANQRSAVDCYVQALGLAEGQADLHAEVSYRYGQFCASVDEEIGGGKEKAIANFRVAVAVGAPSSVARVSSERELDKLQKKRWPF